jgi:hypothetical protein
VLLAAAVVVGGLAEPAPHAAISIMATAATAPSLRTIGIMTPTVSSRGRVRRVVEMTNSHGPNGHRGRDAHAR